MILHLVNKSPFENNACSTALRFLGETDTILLIENGVYVATSTELSGSLISNHKVFALKEDVISRGIENKLMDNITLVDYDGFVELTEKCEKVQSWY